VFFFMPDDLELFVRQVFNWGRGRAVRTQPVIYTCSDCRYDLSIRELSVMIFTLAGESADSLSGIFKMPIRSVYYFRDSGARKLGFNNYREFRCAYFTGNIRLELERLVRIGGRQIFLM